jgi:hypothetical protein
MKVFLSKIPAASTTGLDLNHYRLVSGFLDAPRTQSSGNIMQDIRITCNSSESRDLVLESLRQLVGSIEPGGDGTLTYMAFESLDDKIGARIFGRWERRENLEQFIRKEDINKFWMQNKDSIKAMEQRLYVPNGKGWLHRGSGYAGEKGNNARL